MSTRFRSLFLIILIPLLLNQCAQVAAPPGGPVDKTAPVILSSWPGRDSVNVKRSDRINIEFSESINKNSVEKAVFITPRQSDEPELKWKGNILSIILPDSFAENSTYIVNLGSSISDLRNNKLDESYIFAFSTGENVNRGQVKGAIYKNNKPMQGVTIGLFDQYPSDNLASFDSIYAPYMTQSGKNGEYSLEYLPDGKFFILAFEDNNKNQLFDYPKESFGLSDRDVIVRQKSEISDINLFMTQDDTTTFEVISASVTNNHLVKVRFTKNILSDTLINNLSSIFLQPTDSTIPAVIAKTIAEKRGEVSAGFNIYFGELVDGIYRLKLDRQTFGPKNDSLPDIESAELSVSLSPDLTPPEITDIPFNKKIIFATDTMFFIRFSEPVKQNLLFQGGLSLYNSDSNKITISPGNNDGIYYEFYSPQLDWAESYYISLDNNKIADFAGNLRVDSTDIFNFATYDIDSLGSSSGQIIIRPPLDSTSRAVITFSQTTGGTYSLDKTVKDNFNLVLPPGKYLLSGFLDLNNNKKLDVGQLYPFGYSETVARFEDTIRVRARFETADIKLIFK